MECGVSGPSLDGNGKVLDPNLYLTYTYSEPGKVTLRDNGGHELLSRVLPAPSRFKIGIEGKNLVISAASGENLLRFRSPLRQRRRFGLSQGHKTCPTTGSPSSCTSTIFDSQNLSESAII